VITLTSTLQVAVCHGKCQCHDRRTHFDGINADLAAKTAHSSATKGSAHSLSWTCFDPTSSSRRCSKCIITAASPQYQRSFLHHGEDMSFSCDTMRLLWAFGVAAWHPKLSSQQTAITLPAILLPPPNHLQCVTILSMSPILH
jgi:hypothetical protein